MTEMRTTRNRHFAVLAAAGLVVLAATAIGYRAGRARAEGVPAVQPLTYSGMLEESGSPVTGDRFIFVNLWKDAAGTDTANRACQTLSTIKTPVSAGWFTVDLDPGCTAAVNANPDLWVEVVVEGQPLPRTKLKAVPYALQAGQAARVPWTGVTGIPAELSGRRSTTASIDAGGTVVRQDGAWVASATWNDAALGQGTWTVGFQPGAFTGTPTCFCNGGLNSNGSYSNYYACSVQSVSASGLTIATLYATTSSSGTSAYLAPGRFGFDVVCTGSR